MMKSFLLAVHLAHKQIMSGQSTQNRDDIVQQVMQHLAGNLRRRSLSEAELAEKAQDLVDEAFQILTEGVVKKPSGRKRRKIQIQLDETLQDKEGHTWKVIISSEGKPVLERAG